MNTLYDSSEPQAFRRARSRSHSTASSSSLSDISSSTSSSLSSLDSYELQDIFSTVDNVIVSSDKTWIPPRKSVVRLEFGVRPRRPSLTPEDKLNPQAAPFVPGGGRSSSRNDPPPTPTSRTDTFDTYYDAASLPQTHWSFYFEAGTSHDAIADEYLCESNAVAAVTSNGRWSDEELFFFASHFPGKVYSSTHSSEYPVAPFAFAVYQAFEYTHGPMEAQRFLLALRQHTVNAFLNAWSKESFDPELHAHLEGGLSGHIFASLYLAKFIGDLFNVGLLSKDHVKSCASKLLEGPQSEEHIVALGHLIIQAGPEFWMSPSEPMVLNAKEFEDFIRKFEKAATYMRGSLIEANEHPSGYSARWVDWVRDHFFSWEASILVDNSF